MSVVTFVIVAILEAKTSISIAVLHSVPSGLLAITVYVPGLYTSAIMSSPTTPVWSLPFLYHTYSYSSCGFKTVNVRSEEHTSELQSRENLVCRLLLE